MEKLKLSKIDQIVVGIIALVSLYLIVFQIPNVGLWQDEAASLFYSSSIYWRDLFADTNPPLYNFLLKLSFLILPPTEISARYFGSLVAFTIPIIGYLTASRFYGKKQAFWVAILFSLNAIHIRYALEIRSYILLEFFSVLNLYFYLSSNEKKKLSCGYILSAVALVLTNYVGLALPLAHLLVYAYEKWNKKQEFKWSYLSSAFIFLGAYLFFSHNQWPQHLSIQNVLSHFSLEQSLKKNFVNYFSFAFLCITFAFWKKNRDDLVYKTVFLSLLILIFGSLSLGHIVSVEKYFIFLIPYILIGIASQVVNQQKILRYALLSSYLLINGGRIAYHFNRAHSAWPEIMKKASIYSSVVILAREHSSVEKYFSTFEMPVISFWDIKDLSFPDKKHIIVIEPDSIKANKNTYERKDYQLIDEGWLGLDSYAPAYYYHYAQEN